MLLEFLYPLVRYFTFFNIFQYITFRAVYSAITALLISYLLFPLLIRSLSRLQARQVVREDGPETHQSKSGTPTMGGVLIIISVVVSTLLWQDLGSFYTWLLLGTMLAFGLLGFADDRLKIKHRNSGGLPVALKLGLQLLLSLLVTVALYSRRDRGRTELDGAP